MMRKHIIIIAVIFLLLGTGLGYMFIHTHLYFFSLSASLFQTSSVLDSNSTLLERWSENFGIYMNFFADLGVNPITGLVTIVSSIAFGYGLLKSKEWARKLGFIVIAVNTLLSLWGMFNGNISVSVVLQLALCAYIGWVLTSPETIKLMKGDSR